MEGDTKYRNPEDISEFSLLLRHVGHDIECCTYQDIVGNIYNVSVECMDCNEVLFSIDTPRKIRISHVEKLIKGNDGNENSPEYTPGNVIYANEQPESNWN